MSTQLLVTMTNTAAFEAASGMWVELIMFAAAAAIYALGGGMGLTPPWIPSKKSMASSPRLKGKSQSSAQMAGAKRSPSNVRARIASPTRDVPNDSQSAVASIRACAKAGDLQGAIEVFEKFCAKCSTPGPHVHNCMIEARLQCGDHSGALEHFQEFARRGEADVVTYNIVLKALLGLGRTEEAKELLVAMAGRGLQASRVTFHELLHAKVVAGDRRAMWQLIDEMRTAGHAPDKVTCAILVKSLKGGAHPWHIERIMNLVTELGEQVDEVLLSSLVEACIRLQRLDMVSEVMCRFETQGSTMTLTAPSYGSLIKAYGQARDTARMWQLWLKMKQSGTKPTAVTLGCMVDALATNGRVEEALELVHEVHSDEETRSIVNTVIYSTILKGFSYSRQIDRVFAVHSEMVELGVPFNVISYNTMMDACARCGAMGRVAALLEGMRRGGVDPDLVTYSTLVKGYCLAGDVGRAFEVVKEMRASGQLVPDEIMYNSLLDGCAREHRVEDALRLLEDMQAAGVAPSNHTLSILVKLLGRARRLDEAFKTVEGISARYGFRPNIQVYTCLMQACLHNRRVDRAMAVHDAMVAERSCQPDEKAYSVLLRGCLQAGALDESLQVLRSAYLPGKGSSQKRSPGVGAEMLAEALGRLSGGNAGQREAALTLTADLKARGFSVEDATRVSKTSSTARTNQRHGRRA